MVASRTIVILGASLAGGRAADELREKGFEGRIVLVGAEPEFPYERPPLSKQFLRGELARDKLFLRPPSYYADNNVELRLGTIATDLELAAHQVVLADGSNIEYDKLLLAVGTQVRRLSIPGAELPGVYYLRTLADAEQLSAGLRRASRVVVVGAGFIGSEVAASAKTMGREVTVLEAASVPLARALGPEIGQVCAAIHRDHGIDLRLAAGVQALRGESKVEEVVLADGSRIEADLVVVGVGVLPAAGWLEGSGLALDNGIVVDEFAATNHPDVFAAGDVANWWHPALRKRLRIEHFDHAENHGKAAARSMLGLKEPYAPTPYFWSDQYEHTLQYVGYAAGTEKLAVRGDIESRSFIASYVDGEIIRAAFGIGRAREMTAVRRIIQRGQPIAADVLTDPATDLRAISRSADVQE